MAGIVAPSGVFALVSTTLLDVITTLLAVLSSGEARLPGEDNALEADPNSFPTEYSGLRRGGNFRALTFAGTATSVGCCGTGLVRL